ncbi:NAD(P)H-hydrate dehydratase [Pedobacter cryoconitis]|uniref:Bifunctional NAD(P)H-hydrate repair enzyme n=1 Tax=Pedobacter cryoconitis TaxID=188932 RepID=A0A7X0J5M0_9SPHI|nr:NAD(P)H-hydrate dehydratase [Pedobacter cryoconitis]MBB6500277.1 NAD(P)H-hydrate epimerase [Pedobacter cryoconitis]
MQNLLNQEQMRLADAFTIKDKRITSIELMEDAATAFAGEFLREFSDKEAAIAILCGKGNNGADGLAVARILKDYGYDHLSVYLFDFSAKETEDYKTNLNRLKEMWFPLTTVKTVEELKKISQGVIIDAVLGSGLNKPLSGIYLEVATCINNLNRKVIAIDVPTGFPAEGVLDETYNYIKADLVICFQRPKINFFFPESAGALKRFKTVQIGLDEDFIERQDSPYKLLDEGDIKILVKPREPFTHKGTYGHALLIAGQKKTMGAALLAARACLSGGAGLTTVSIPESGLTALNTSLPEVMYLDRAELNFTEAGFEKFKAIAIGPGLGTGAESKKILEELFKLSVPLIVDADALHLLGDYEDLFKQLPEGSILTPHMKEFDHLFGVHDSWWARLETARDKAVKLNCVIVLKNQYTFIIDQKGKVKINSTGNPAMGQGGMGDVLTGLIASFLAQGYQADQAAYLSCYLHGQSGDDLAKNRVSVTASAVADHVSEVLKRLII